MTLQTIFDALLGQVGLLVALILILWAGSRGIWVFGWYAAEQRERINRLEGRLDRAVGAGEHLAGTAERATRLAEGARNESSRD